MFWVRWPEFRARIVLVRANRWFGRVPALRSRPGCARRRARSTVPSGGEPPPRRVTVPLCPAAPGSRPCILTQRPSSSARARTPALRRAPSGLAKLAHLPQKTLGEVELWRAFGANWQAPAGPPAPPIPSPSPTNCVGEGRIRSRKASPAPPLHPLVWGSGRPPLRGTSEGRAGERASRAAGEGEKWPKPLCPLTGTSATTLPRPLRARKARPPPPKNPGGG